MKVKFEGKEVEATEVEVVHSEEKWNTYQLVDGKELSFKPVLTLVVKLNDVKSPDGGPIYQFQAQNVVKVR